MSHEGSPYLVAELLLGQSLRDRLAGAALPAKKAVEYAMEIALGLAAAPAKSTAPTSSPSKAHLDSARRG